jgi:phage terminase small subunit
MAIKLTIKDMTGLTPQHANFLIEYIKDFSARAAAERSGFAPDYGFKLLEREDIAKVLSIVMQQRLESAGIDAEWLLMELVDNHVLARQQGKITASTGALDKIARHAAVDAYSAEKVHIVGDDMVRERLLRARKREVPIKAPTQDSHNLDFF